jgi:hypothetical protein
MILSDSAQAVPAKVLHGTATAELSGAYPTEAGQIGKEEATLACGSSETRMAVRIVPKGQAFAFCGGPEGCDANRIAGERVRW